MCIRDSLDTGPGRPLASRPELFAAQAMAGTAERRKEAVFYLSNRRCVGEGRLPFYLERAKSVTGTGSDIRSFGQSADHPEGGEAWRILDVYKRQANPGSSPKRDPATQPKVEPIKKVGTISPPLNPAPMVTAVKRIFSAKASGRALPPVAAVMTRCV